MFRSTRLLTVLSLLVVAGLIFSACTPAATPTAAPEVKPTTAPQVQPTKAPEVKPTEPPPPPPTAEPVGRKSKDPTVFNYLKFGDPETLDPHIDYESAGIGILFNIYEGLIVYDGAEPLKFVPQLAKAIPEPVTADDGSVTYTWEIIDGVKFHNGDDLTTEDVAYSFWRSMLLGDPNTPAFLLLQAFFDVDDATQLVDPEGNLVGDPEALKSADAATLEAACQRVKDAVTFDETKRTVTMKLVHPWGPFLPTLAGGAWATIMDKKWNVENGDWDGDCKTWQNFYGIPTESGILRDKTNGTGPYMLDKWEPEQEVVLIANPNYRKGEAVIKRAVYKNVQEFGTRFAALQAGDADAIDLGSVADRVQMDTLVAEDCDINTGECQPTDNPNGILRAYKGRLPLTRTDIIFIFDTGENSPYIGSGKLDGQGIPPTFFQDLHVRRAFNYCFDYDTYIQDVQLGEGVRSLAVTLPGQPGYDGTPIYEHDLAKCEEEFKLAEWKAEDGTSLWDIGFYMQIGYNAGNTGRQAIAEILAQNIGQVNSSFFISPLALPWPLFLRTRQQFGMFTSGWIEDIHDPHNWYVPFLTANGTYSFRAKMPKELTDKYAPYIADGVRETDLAKRAVIYSELNKLVHEDAPFIILSLAPSKHYEPLYLKGWYEGLNRNPLVNEWYFYEFSKD